ncbi:hypothetical protein F5Y19DRAFT_441035 [Xylariaceae sp. FL1651]|nr:hypothetical protein F5Y19DRAFT_441035 [Xylariaceae sp. FL1651]
MESSHGRDPHVGPDEVFPVHLIDQTALVRSSLISYTFKYEQVLDASKLRDSLSTLLASKEWRKVGGRLRVDKAGKLEIHVPIKFTPDRPPIRFSHVHHDMRMDQHHLARRLPKKTGDKPSLHEGCHTFREFSIPTTLPNDIKHYLSTDEPLVCLHITTFADGTLVSITFPHSLTDAMGTSSLIRAWAHVLLQGGCESLDIHPEGMTNDILASVGSPSDKAAEDTKFVLEDQETRGLSLLALGARFAFDMFARRNIQTKIIYLPANFISHLRQQASKDLKLGSGDEDGGVSFVSDGDIITAWGSRMILSSAPSRGSALICNVFDMRKRVDGIHWSPTAAYLQNLILPSTTALTADEATTLSVSQLAGRVRKAIVEQTTGPQVRSLMRIARSWFVSPGTMPLFASWDAIRAIFITNWAKARFLDQADFAPAVEREETRQGVGTLKPVAYWGTTLSVTDNPRDVFVIYGKDNDGDYWVHGYLRAETWELIQNELEGYCQTLVAV